MHPPTRRFDERCRLLLFAGFLLIVTGTPAEASRTFFGLGATLLVLIGISGVQLRTLARHLFLALPFLLLVIIGLPAPIMKPILTRSLLALGAASTLIGSTTFPRLMQGMTGLGVPRLFVLLIGFTWRYLHLLQEEALKLRQAAVCRGWQGRHWAETRTVGHLIGTLFLRSYERGERVHAAMLSRGWQHHSEADVTVGGGFGNSERGFPSPADLLFTAGLLFFWLWMRFSS